MRRRFARTALAFAARGNGAFLVSCIVAAGAIAVIAAAVLFWDDSEPARNFGILLSLSIALPVALWRIILQARQATAAESSARTGASAAATAQREALDHQLRTGTEMVTSETKASRAAGAFLLERLANDHPSEYDQVVYEVLTAARSASAGTSGEGAGDGGK